MSGNQSPTKADLNKTKAQLIEELVILRREREDIGASPAGDGQLSASAHASKILEIADDAIISVDENYRITFFNRGAVYIFGFTREEAIDQPIDLLLPEEVRKIHGQHVRNFAQAKEDSRLMGQRTELYGLRKNGERFPVEASISKSDVEGKKFFTVILRDISQRKATDEELRLSQRLLRTVVDAVPHTIVVKDRESRYKLVNRAWCEFYGVDPKNALNVHSLDIPGRPEQDRKQVVNEDQLVINGDGLPKVFDHTRKDNMGRTRFLQNIRTPIKNENGDIEGLVAIALDITERKLAEEELQSNQNLLRTIIDAIPFDILAQNVDGERILANRLYLELLGIASEAEFPPAGVDPHLSQSEIATADKNRRKVVEQGQSLDYERLGKSENGPEQWVRVRWVPIRSGKEIVGSLLLNSNITERKRNEEELRENQRLLQTVLNSIPHWVYVKDLQSRYMLVNRAMADTFGVNPEDMIGLHTKDFRKQSNIRIGEEDDLDALVRMDRKVIDSLEAIEVPEFTLNSPEGNLRIHHIIKVPITNESGAAVGVVGISEDITQRKAMEQHLQESQKLEAVGELAGGIAHEFNNMLQVIINGIHYVRNDFHGSESAKKYLDIVLKSAVRSAELTSQLLTYSRKTELKSTALNIGGLTADLINMVRTIIGENIVLESKQADELYPVKADRGMLEQVLVNLSVNARDALPNGGRLIFETRNYHADQIFCDTHGLNQPGDFVMISVSDNGTGMTSEIREHIFEPFFTTKEVGQGTGLGLAMVHGIVQQHGGVIEVLSEAGIGSTFNIYLPKADSQERTKEATTAKDIPGGKETILVAEDEEDVLNMLSITLERGGYRVLTAKDGAEAMVVFKANSDRIDLVITDMVMPNLRGRQVYEQIRDSGSDVPVLFSTGYALNSTDAAFASGKGVRTIQKPYAPNVLFTTVREVLNQR